jgi:hypothetical protein
MTCTGWRGNGVDGSLVAVGPLRWVTSGKVVQEPGVLTQQARFSIGRAAHTQNTSRGTEVSLFR